MAITTSGATVTILPGTYALALGVGGLDGTGTSLATTVAAGATLNVGAAGEAAATAIVFTALTAALGSTVNFIGGSDTVAALTSAGGALNVTGGGTLTVNDLTNVSAITQLNVGAGSSLVLGPAVDLTALEQIDFAGSAGTLVINSQGLSVNLLTGITDFSAGDNLTVTGANYDPAQSSYDPVTNTLHLVTTGGAAQAIQLAGTAGNASFAGEYFHITNSASGATIFLNTDATNGFVACYAKGTHVLTTQGEVLVEDLVIGDALVTVSGQARELRWIGRRSYAGRFLARSPALQPVLIEAGALDDNVPHRDLSVSQEHAMLIDGVLIPARCLINGNTIKLRDQNEVHYFHLELETHDVILAEGAASETFIDDDSRGVFNNATSYWELYPDAATTPACYYAPRIESGYPLQMTRDRLAERGTDIRRVA